MESKLFSSGLKTYFILGLKFGVAGALIAFIFQAYWGNLEEVKYTIIMGFFTGFFVGFFELIFSNLKVGRLPYLVILLLRSVTYFLINLETRPLVCIVSSLEYFSRYQHL